MSESLVLKNILLKFGSKAFIRLFRNNVGSATTATGSFIKFGLCPGSSDIIGITTLKITQDMVGKDVGIFTAIEVKGAKGKIREDQLHFIDMIKERGGIAGVARSNKDVDIILNTY